jgi:hypothetical protein
MSLIREIIDANQYMTLGTADESSTPWASPVWFAHEDYREFLWVSAQGARHSRNLAVRPQLGIVIFDSHAPVGTGQGVYAAATASDVTGADIDRWIAIFSCRSVAQGAPAWTAEDVRPPARLRLYRATATEWYLGDRGGVRTPVSV